MERGPICPTLFCFGKWQDNGNSKNATTLSLIQRQRGQNAPHFGRFDRQVEPTSRFARGRTALLASLLQCQ